MAPVDDADDESPVRPGPPRLRDLQRLFYELITAPTGVGPALADRGLTPGALEAVVVGDAQLSSVARLDVYANMYFFRILDVLRAEYPRVVAALGDDAFHDLLTDHLLVHRPRHPSLREVGARLPDYVASHAVSAGRPWLAEVARLERGHRELFDGLDARPLTFEGLRGLSPGAFAALAVGLIPCHRLLSNRFAVSAAWEALASGPAGVGTAPASLAAPRAELVLVWRRDLDVRHRVIEDGAEAAMLAQASAGSTLASLCEAFASVRSTGTAPELEAASIAAEAFQTLARWVDDGLLAELTELRLPALAG
jgi:hypothetical protein